MDRSRLPKGLAARLAAAGRAAAASLASPAITGPQAVQAVTGVSAGTVSKWFSEAHDEAPTIEAVAVIEMTSGVPHYARALAALTGHEVVPIADAEAPSVRLDEAVMGLDAAAHRLLGEMHEALKDHVVNPAEARALLAAIGGLEGELTAIAAELARKVEG